MPPMFPLTLLMVFEALLPEIIDILATLTLLVGAAFTKFLKDLVTTAPPDGISKDAASGGTIDMVVWT